MWVRTDGCDISYSKLTIGGDPSRVGEEDYLFIPQDSNTASNSWTDEDCNLSKAIIASGDVICTIEETVIVTGESPLIEEHSPPQHNLDIEKIKTLPSGRNAWEVLKLVPGVMVDSYDISGETTSDIPGYCIGDLDGRIVKEGTLGIEIDSWYTYYSTYSDSNYNVFRGWITFTIDGIPIEVSNITEVVLKDSNGIVVNHPVDVNDLWTGTYFMGSWNPLTSSVDFSGPFVESGLSIWFPGGYELPAINFTYEVTTSEDDIISKTFYFPGKEELPVPESADMSSAWLGGDLHLEWINPVGEYDGLQVVVRDEHWNGLSISLPSDVNEATIPEEWIENFLDCFESTTLNWSVQTRSSTDEDMNSARGNSNELQIPPFPPMF